MGFVEIGFLAALGAVAIPIIVHLLFRLRARRVELGSVRFLREVLQKNARRNKLKRRILLLLRMGGVALLACLFARPYLIAQGRGGGEGLVAMLIDRSASMALENDGQRRIDAAVARAKEIIEKSSKGTRFEVAFFDRTLTPLGEGNAGTADPHAGIADQLVAPEATFFATDYGAAIAWARDVCVNATATRKELHVLTDLQRSGLDWSDVQPMPADVRVHLHDLGRSSVNNVAVTAAEPTRTLVRPGDPAKINVTVFNGGPFPLKDVPVRLYLQSERRNHNQRQHAHLKPGAMETLEFEVPSLESGLWEGHVALDVADELPFDNRRYLALMAAPPWKVLIVNGQPHDSRVLGETYFLETALRLAAPGESFADSPYQPRVVSGATWPKLADYDLVILANVSAVSDEQAANLNGFVSAGGGLVVFCGENVEAAGYRIMDATGLTAGAILGMRQTGDLPWRIHKWETEHSIFQPFADPQHGDLRRLAFQAYTRIQPAKDAKVLASYRGGDPALIQRTHGEGRVLWFTSTCDRQWTDWPRHQNLYLPLVHQMLGHLTGLNEGGPVRFATIDAVGIRPLDRSSSLKAGLQQPGVYRRQRHWQVVNASPRESEMERCTAEEFADRFALRLHGEDARDPEQPRPVAATTTLELRDDEFWHWLVFALLGLLCVECFLANRTTA